MTKPTIVTRATKGSALTWTEGDTNLTNLRDATLTVKAGTGGTDVVSDLNGTVTLVAGTNITLSGDNTAKTVTINASGGSSGITDLVQDTSPQLGGDLDVNGHQITSNSNGNIAIVPNGSGNIQLTPGTGKITLGANDWPSGPGSSGQVLTTAGGTGVLSWTTISSGATNLDGLSDVVLTSPATNNVLRYDGTNWVNTAASTLSVDYANTADSASSAGMATYAQSVTLTADNTTNATNYPLFTNAATGNLSPRTDTGFTYNPSTGVLTSTTFSGALNGNATTATSATTATTATNVSGTVALANGGTGQTTAPAAMAALMGFTTTATAAGTTTLTASSSYYQVFTGTSTQTVILPATNALATGWSYHIVNNSTGALTLQSSNAVTLTTIPASVTCMATVTDATSGAQSSKWETGFTDFSALTGTGSVVLATSPTLTTPNLGTPSAITLTNASGTASININGTVGATTANTGAFTTTTIKTANELRFNNSADTFYVGFKAGSVAANKIWTLPTADGTANQVLKTDGAGNLGWATAGSSGNNIIVLDINAEKMTFGTTGTFDQVQSWTLRTAGGVSGVSVSTNTFTLPAGTYHITIPNSYTTITTGATNLTLYDTTNSADLGETGFLGITIGGANARMQPQWQGIVTLAGSATFIIRAGGSTLGTTGVTMSAGSNYLGKFGLVINKIA